MAPVQCKIKSGWGYTVSCQDRTIQKASGSTGLTMSIMCIEITAITEALKWLVTNQYKQATCLTDSMNLCVSQLVTGCTDAYECWYQYKANYVYMYAHVHRYCITTEDRRTKKEQ